MSVSGAIHQCTTTTEGATPRKLKIAAKTKQGNGNPSKAHFEDNTTGYGFFSGLKLIRVFDSLVYGRLCFEMSVYEWFRACRLGGPLAAGCKACA